MSLSNRLTLKTMIPLYVVIMLALSLLISLPANAATAPFTSYPGCVSYVGPVFSKRSVGAIRQNYINPLVAGRIKTLDKLAAKAATLSPDQAAVITNGINADKASLTAIKTKDATVTDIHTLRDDYCKAIYSTQVNQFRTPQVIYLQKLNARLVADTKLSNALNKQAASGQFSGDIQSRLNMAKDLIASNLYIENQNIPGVLNASVSFDGTNYVNNLPPVSQATFDTLSKNFQSAYTAYTEIVVLKIASKGFNPSKPLALVSMNLSNNGQPVSNPSKANKAVARIKVGAKQYDRTMTRKDSNFVWHVDSTKPVQ